MLYSARQGLDGRFANDNARALVEIYYAICPSHHQCQTLAGDAGPVTGGGGLRVSKMGKLQDMGKLVSFMYRYMYVVVMCMLVIVAPPIVMGVWSMAFLLGQHVEYYY